MHNVWHLDLSSLLVVLRLFTYCIKFAHTTGSFASAAVKELDISDEEVN